MNPVYCLKNRLLLYCIKNMNMYGQYAKPNPNITCCKLTSINKTLCQKKQKWSEIPFKIRTAILASRQINSMLSQPRSRIPIHLPATNVVYHYKKGKIT